MGNNLHVSYDLHSPNQNYEAVATAIKSLGGWAKIHKSFWYVNSAYTATKAAEIIWAAMDSNDTLYVVDASSNTSAWYNLSKEVQEHIQQNWYR